MVYILRGQVTSMKRIDLYLLHSTPRISWVSIYLSIYPSIHPDISLSQRPILLSREQ